MTNYFVINSDYAVEFVPTGEPTTTENFAIVESAKDLEALPSNSLVEIWNAIAGTPGFTTLKPVRKFENRTKAARRIWDAIQVLRKDPLAGAKPKVTNLRIVTAAEAKAAHKEELKARAAAKPAPETKPVAEATEAEAAAPRETAKAKVVEMLRAGTTLDAIMSATGWQRHTVRGFISGTVHKRMGLAVIAHTDEETKVRHYQIAGQA